MLTHKIDLVWFGRVMKPWILLLKIIYASPDLKRLKKTIHHRLQESEMRQVTCFSSSSETSSNRSFGFEPDVFVAMAWYWGKSLTYDQKRNNELTSSDPGIRYNFPLIFHLILLRVFHKNKWEWHLQTVVKPVSFSCKGARSNMFFQQFAKFITIFPFSPSQLFLLFRDKKMRLENTTEEKKLQHK